MLFSKKSKIKKVVSVLLSMLIAVSSIFIPMTAFAGNDTIVTAKFTGVERNDLINGVVQKINADREVNGYKPLLISAERTTQAKLRAMEILVYADTANDNLPTDKPITDRISDYGTKSSTGFFRVTTPSVNSIYDNLKSLADRKPLKNIGIGIFTAGGVTSVYYIVSSAVDEVEYTDFAKKSLTAEVKTKLKYLSPKIVLAAENNYKRYKISVKAYPVGMANTLPLPNSLFTFTSSNSGIVKIKGAYAYLKKNGSYTITAKFKAATAATFKYNGKVSVFKSTKVSGLSATSKKKAQFTAKWKKNLTDITGYQLQYSTSSDFKSSKSVYITNKKTVTKTITKLKSKKTYYVRIRGYYNQGNDEKCYTSWSAKVKVKTK